MVEGNEAVSRWYLETQASPQSQAQNRANGVRTAEQGRSPEQRIADMDLMGIDIQAISPAPRQTYYGADADLGLAVSREINDFIAEICAKHPDRFVGLGTVPFQAPELAVAELDRIHRSHGFRGIEIMTHVAGEDLSGERFRKIFARCEELGLLVFMHSDGFTEARRFHDHYFANVIGNPLDTTVALHHLIFGGVLQDFPNLKLVASHGGGYLPAYPGRIDHAAAARPDTCTCLRHMPSTYLKRLYFDALVYTHHQLDFLVERIRGRPHPGRNRLSCRHGRDRPGRVYRERAVPRRYRAARDPRRQRGASVEPRNAGKAGLRPEHGNSSDLVPPGRRGQRDHRRRDDLLPAWRH